MMTHYLAFFIAVSLSLLLTPLVRVLAWRIGAVDVPGARKIHTIAVPRLGGLGIIISTLFTLLIVWGYSGGAAIAFAVWKPILLGVLIVFGVGFWDDVHPLPKWVKLLFQSVAAWVAIAHGIRVEHLTFLGGYGIHLGLWALPLSFIWIIGITNAFNLMDGLDGLAAGLAVIAAGSNILFCFIIGNTQNSLLPIVLLGATLGFIPYNFYPAKIFLGDSGSLVLGYVLAVTALSSTQKNGATLEVVVPLLVFGLPIVDTLLSMIRRFIVSFKSLKQSRGWFKLQLDCAKCMFESDQRHIHHQLLVLGFSHRNTVLLLYVIGLGLSLFALLSVVAQYRNTGMLLIIVGVTTYAGICKLGYDEIGFVRTGTIMRWYEQTKFNRRLVLGCIDVMLIALAYWGAFLLKYDAFTSTELHIWYWQTLPIELVVQLSIFVAFGLYQKVWRAAEVHDLLWASLAVLTANALSYTLGLLRVPPQGILSFFLINTLLLGFLVISIRSGYRVLASLCHCPRPAGMAALIYGAGQSGQYILQELRQHPHYNLQPIGILDDDTSLHGRTVSRVPVLGSVDDLKSIIENSTPFCLVIPADHQHDARLYGAIAICRERQIAVMQGGRRFRILFTPQNLCRSALSLEEQSDELCTKAQEEVQPS